MIYVLIWMFLGSLSLNILWIKRSIDRENDFGYETSAYIRGLVLGLISGPFVLILAWYANRGKE